MNHCPNCQREIDTSLSNCPYCSFPLPKMEYDGVVNNITKSNKKEKGPIQEVKKEKTEVQEPNAFEQFEEVMAKIDKKTKKSKKVVVLTIILILLVFIVIGLYGFILYNKFFINKEKKVEIVTETKEEVKLITEYVLSEQEALGLGNYLWNYALDTVWCKNFTYSEETTDLENGLKGYEITNYQDVASNFSLDFTYEYKDKDYRFSNIHENHVVNNKYYDVNKCSRDKDKTYGNTEIKIKDNQLGNIKFTAISNYCNNLGNNEECQGDKITKTVEKEFNIVKEDDKWKIQKFSIPNQL